MENLTYNSFYLRLEGLPVSRSSLVPVFTLFLASYVFIMVANVANSVLIFTDKNLQQPMYLLLCNLSVSDIIGGTHIVPRLLSDLILGPSEAVISYPECVTQAFVTHVFATTSHTVLMVMAFDRYVAICDPLRYAAIMTGRMLIKLTIFAWGSAIFFVSILIGLTVRLNRCRTIILNPYCDNASLFKLSCESTSVNNVYGLLFTVILLSSSIGSMVLTYSKITIVCLTSKNRSLNRKALQTCSTHLVVYLIMLVSGIVVITLHRFPQFSDYRKLAAILLFTVPGSANPIIYGAQSRHIRRFWRRAFQSGTGPAVGNK